MQSESKSMFDFNQIMEEKIAFLDAHDHMSLATSSNDLVSVRTVTYVNDGLDIYVITNRQSKKHTQIETNPQVSVCIDNVQIIGKAEILGEPLDEKNSAYADIYRRKLPDIFARYAPIPVMEFVKITPTLFETWVRTPSRVYYEHLDMDDRKAYVFKELGKP